LLLVIFRALATVLEWALAPLAALMLWPIATLARALRPPGSAAPRLLFGPTPVINNKYWAQAFQRTGAQATSWMYPPYAINKISDFDRYVFTGQGLLGKAWDRLGARYSVFTQSLFAFDVFHIPMSGWVLGTTPLWWMEGPLLTWAGAKTVVLPFGGDFYRYSQVLDVSLRQGLLMSYPLPARDEAAIQSRVSHWVRHADAVVAGFQFDGMGRWDALPVSTLCIDLEAWPARTPPLGHDGRSGVVRVTHAPNHRGFKGTEFVLRAVELLQSEGLQVSLKLVERVPNDEVRRILHEETDILVDQIIATGYAMAAVEGMASGLPVMSNLVNPSYAQSLRRYSHLESCPLVPTTPENLLTQLRALVTQPELRQSLGQAGRRYAECFHSQAAFVRWMGAIHRKHWGGEAVDLWALFHPLQHQPLPPVKSPLHPEPTWWGMQASQSGP
jgi:hypothetical protein